MHGYNNDSIYKNIQDNNIIISKYVQVTLYVNPTVYNKKVYIMQQMFINHYMDRYQYKRKHK